MKICVVGTAINPVPTDVAWSGIESLVTYLTKGLVELGNEVTLVSVKGSLWKDWSELNLIEVPVVGPDIEKSFYDGYKDKIRDFDCVIDNSNGKLARTANRKVIQISHWIQHPLSMGYRNVVCISQAHAQWTREHYLDKRKKPEVVYNGVDPAAFPIGKDKTDEFLFLSVLAPYKGADIALNIALEHPEFTIGFAGRNTSYTDTVKRAAEEHSNVKFYGEVSHDYKKVLMGKAKALLQPSKPYNPYERFPFLDIFPMTIVEANLCGTSAIGLANGGVPEMIEDGTNGYLVKSQEEMVEAMRKIDIHWSLPRGFAIEQFHYHRMCKQYLNLAEKVARGENW